MNEITSEDMLNTDIVLARDKYLLEWLNDKTMFTLPDKVENILLGELYKLCDWISLHVSYCFTQALNET